MIDNADTITEGYTTDDNLSLNFASNFLNIYNFNNTISSLGMKNEHSYWRYVKPKQEMLINEL